LFRLENKTDMNAAVAKAFPSLKEISICIERVDVTYSKEVR